MLHTLGAQEAFSWHFGLLTTSTHYYLSWGREPLLLHADTLMYWRFQLHGTTIKISLVPSLSAPQIFIAYSMKNWGVKSGWKSHDDACRNVTNLTSRISLAPRNFVPRHQSLVQTPPNSRIALSKAFTDTSTAIYPRKGTSMYVWKGFGRFTKPWLTLVARNSIMKPS